MFTTWFWDFDLCWPKMTLNCTKNNGDHVVHMANLHTKYEVSATICSLVIVFTRGVKYTHTYTRPQHHIDFFCLRQGINDNSRSIIRQCCSRDRSRSQIFPKSLVSDWRPRPLYLQCRGWHSQPVSVSAPPVSTTSLLSKGQNKSGRQAPNSARQELNSARRVPIQSPRALPFPAN